MTGEDLSTHHGAYLPDLTDDSNQQGHKRAAAERTPTAATPVPPASPRPGRHTLSRNIIISTASDFIDAHGVPALTMRRLSAELDVQAMSLYRYVSGRDDLLNGVAEALTCALHDDPAVYLEPRDGWADYLQRLAHGIRRIAVAHPAAFPLMATLPHASWARPPLRDPRWTQSFLAALTTHGFTPKLTVRVRFSSPAPR